MATAYVDVDNSSATGLIGYIALSYMSMIFVGMLNMQMCLSGG